MKRHLDVQAVPTRIFNSGESLSHFVVEVLTAHRIALENKIVVVTSKIVSLAECRTVKKQKISKYDLVMNEADEFLGEIGYGCFLTIKHGLFIPSAGIDESNSQDDSYILFPKDPFYSAQNLWTDLARHYNLHSFGVLITDSHTAPLRRGVTGVALAYSGFSGIDSQIGRNDLFGRKMQMTEINRADAFATAAVLCMGEADNCCPLAVLSTSEVNFFTTNADSLRKETVMEKEKDLYYPIYKDRL